MKKLSKTDYYPNEYPADPCYVCAYEEDGKVMELRFEPVGENLLLEIFMLDR